MSKFQPGMGAGNYDLERFMEGVKNDLIALQTAITTITAQLDADGGVTDTDYAANADPTLETS